MKADIERIYITHENKQHRWPKMLEAIRKWVGEGVRVTIEPKVETRRQILNRLAHVWRKEIGQFDGEKDLNAVWGRLKFDYLLNLKLADEKERERAEYEVAMIRQMTAFSLASDELEGVSKRDVQIEVAFDIVRSKDIGVGLFAEWLNTIQQVYAEQGLVLTSTSEERKKALQQIEDDIAEGKRL